MDKFGRVKSIILTACIVAGLGGWMAPMSAEAGPLVFDKEIGHYKDLSYDALSDEGLSWEERASLFGGETVHYGELTDAQRKAKAKELETLLARIAMQNKLNGDLTGRTETEIVTWLDEQAKTIPAAYTVKNRNNVRNGAIVFFRAYEILGDKKYLEAGLARADLILKAQWPKGHWTQGRYGADVIKIQDGTTTRPFWIMLYAHKISGDKKYLDSARRCADLLLSLQRKGGGWPDRWRFKGRDGHSGVIHGISFNDGATNDPFHIMVMMYHITKDKKYIAKLGNLGPFIVKANIGEGKVTGWAEQYHDNAKPVRARQYEIELPYSKALTRGVGPLLIWLYLMTGDEAHIDLLRKGYAWHEHVRKLELDPKQLAQWKAISEAWSPTHHAMTTESYMMEYRPGWPTAYLPDGSNWGSIRNFKLQPYYPVTAEQKKKYGRFINQKWPPLTELVKRAHANQTPPRNGGMYVYTHSSIGNSLSEIRRALLEHKRGGRKGMLKYYSNPTKYTPDQYLQACVDAAKRVLDKRNRRMALPFVGSPGYTGMSAMRDFGFLGRKGRWYGRQGTKWGQAFDLPYPRSNAQWYQWQLVYDMKLAQGKIDADAAARGGRGLETIATQTHLDSWDVLGEWGMAIHELESHFDVPIGKK